MIKIDPQIPKDPTRIWSYIKYWSIGTFFVELIFHLYLLIYRSSPDDSTAGFLISTIPDCIGLGVFIGSIHNAIYKHTANYKKAFHAYNHYGQIQLIKKQASPTYKPTVALTTAYPYQLKCPKCLSTNLTANNKGFGLGKAAVGGVLLGPVGLLGGLIGSKKAVFICLNCGNQFQK